MIPSIAGMTVANARVRNVSTGADALLEAKPQAKRDTEVSSVELGLHRYLRTSVKRCDDEAQMARAACPVSVAREAGKMTSRPANVPEKPEDEGVASTRPEAVSQLPSESVSNMKGSTPSPA
jgi:hypothetical protein